MPCGKAHGRAPHRHRGSFGNPLIEQDACIGTPTPIRAPWRADTHLLPGRTATVTVNGDGSSPLPFAMLRRPIQRLISHSANPPFRVCLDQLTPDPIKLTRSQAQHQWAAWKTDQATMQHQSTAKAISTQDLVLSLEILETDDGSKMNLFDCVLTLAEVALAMGFCSIVNLVAM